MDGSEHGLTQPGDPLRPLSDNALIARQQQQQHHNQQHQQERTVKENAVGVDLGYNSHPPRPQPAKPVPHAPAPSGSINGNHLLLQRRGAKDRGSVGCSGLQDDLQELRQQFDILNNQLQHLPVSSSRRDSLLGHFDRHHPHHGSLAKQAAEVSAAVAAGTAPISSAPPRQDTLPLFPVSPPATSAAARAAGLTHAPPPTPPTQTLSHQSAAHTLPHAPSPSPCSSLGNLGAPPHPAMKPPTPQSTHPGPTNHPGSATHAASAPAPGASTAHRQPSAAGSAAGLGSSEPTQPHATAAAPPASSSSSSSTVAAAAAAAAVGTGPQGAPAAAAPPPHPHPQRHAQLPPKPAPPASAQPASHTRPQHAHGASSHAPVPAPLPASVFSASAADLAARATSMQDCPLDSRDSRAERLFHFPASVPFDSKALKLAGQVFEDPELIGSCEEGQSKQLKRTKDGATEQSRIQELAGLVKVLRKNVRELGSRTSSYVEQCIKFERELVQQIETVQLSSECAIKTLEAELAGTKSSLAGFEASFKADKASWGAELEGAKYEGSRLKRELERVTEERDRARDEGKRAEQLRQQLELELKELRKAASQQMREVAVSQSEAVRIVNDEKVAAEKREAHLKEDNTRLAQRLEAASGCVEALQHELSVLQQLHDKAKDGLQSKTSSEEVAVQRANQLQGELSSCQGLLKALEEEVAALRQQLASADARRGELEEQLSTANAELQAVRTQLEGANDKLSADSAAWEAERTELQANADSAVQREQALFEEKNALKAALTATLSQKEEADMMLAQSARELASLTNECTNLRHQVDFVAGQQAAAEERAAGSDQALAAARTEMGQMQQEAGAKDERLAVLEGEFAALKEVIGDAGGQRDVVQILLSRISSLQTAVASADGTRRKMHNELVSIRGNIRVYCRLRPHPTPVLRCSPDQTGLTINVDGKEHGFGYDRVFQPAESQEEVFSTVSELVQSALDGYHVCLFSYGQTGAGKTYTMQGGNSHEQRGIIPRSVEKILDTAHKLREQDWEYTMQASFVEVYNNSLRDLLGGPNAPFINDQSAIKHDANGGHTHVAGVSREEVPDMETAQALISRASANRACGSTAMNSESSRSHVVFMLYIHGVHPPSGTDLRGCLCLVDLAGSERLDRSQAEDARKKEACAINQSLSALGDIFASLASRSSHVPYRNSKLTYLLQPCLGGQGKTLMFVNINPEPASAHESLCSLKFAAKVNGCETGAKGGARRHATGSGGGLLPSQMTLGAGEPKRFSLPGPPKAGMSTSGGITPRGGPGGGITPRGGAMGSTSMSGGSGGITPRGGPTGGGSGDAGAGGPKRQSLYATAGGAGAKRPPPSGGCPPPPNAKRTRF